MRPTLNTFNLTFNKDYIHYEQYLYMLTKQYHLNEKSQYLTT